MTIGHELSKIYRHDNNLHANDDRYYFMSEWSNKFSSILQVQQCNWLFTESQYCCSKYYTIHWFCVYTFLPFNFIPYPFRIIPFPIYPHYEMENCYNDKQQLIMHVQE